MTIGSRKISVNSEATSFDICAIERISGLTARQIQNVARLGLINPIKKDYKKPIQVSFQDILVLRRIGQLISSQCSFRSILTQLSEVVASFNPRLSLTSFDVTTIGPYLVIKTDGCYQHITSGQTFFDFDVDSESTHSNVLQFRLNTDPPPSQSFAATLQDSELERILASDELNSDDWFNLGIQFESFNEFARARNAYRNAIGLDENNIDAYINLGRLLQLDDKYRDAKKLYEKVLQLRPENELANYNLGTLFDMLDEYELAVRYYLRAPNMAMAHHNLARIYEHLGNEVKAARHTSRKLELEQE